MTRWLSRCLSLFLIAALLPAGLRADSSSTLRRTTYRLSGLDPIRAADVYAAKAVGLIYEGLYQYAYATRPYRIVPGLAEGPPAISPDGLTYRFQLRPDVRFAADPCFVASNGNGRPVSAADFVYSIKRLADLKNASPGYWIFRDRIRGLDAFREQSGGTAPTDYGREVAGLRAVSDHVFEIELTKPYPQLMWILAMSYAFAVPHEAVASYGDAFGEHPVGTGPYQLSSWRRHYRLELERNPDWTPIGEPIPTPDGRPAIERIQLFVIDDPSTRWLAFLSGQLDLCTEISRDNWDVVITPDRALTPAIADLGIQLSSIASLDTAYIAFNMDDPVVGRNAALRQAMTCAFNTEETVRFYNQRIIRAKGPIPPGIAGHLQGDSPYPHDLERARGLLADAGYKDGIDPATGRRLKLSLELGRTDSDTRESTELLIDFMDRLGVVIEPNYNNWPSFLDKLERRQAQMFRIAWLADYPDAENFLQLFYGPNESPGPNRCNYKNSDLDALYEQARVMQDSPARTALYRKMEDMIIADAPWIFMYHRLDFNLNHGWLENYHPHDFPYGMEKYYRINPAKRTQWLSQQRGAQK